MTIKIYIENSADSKFSISVTNMTEHAWAGGNLGPENIYEPSTSVEPGEKKEFILWSTRHLLVREHNDL